MHTDNLVGYIVPQNNPETKIDPSPIRIPNTTVKPPTPHVLLEAPLFPEVWVGVGLVSVEVGEGDSEDDDNIEDNDEGGGGNEIDVAEGPTSQNLLANCSPVKSSCGQSLVKHDMILCLNPSL